MNKERKEEKKKKEKRKKKKEKNTQMLLEIQMVCFYFAQIQVPCPL